MTKKSNTYSGMFLMVSLLLLASSPLTAQKPVGSVRNWDFGVTGAFTHNSSASTWPYGGHGVRVSNDLKNQLYRVGWAAGFYANRTLNQRWDVRLDLQHATASFRNDLKVTNNPGQGNYQIQYVQTSLSARYAPFWRKQNPFRLVAGLNLQVPVGYRDYLYAVIDPTVRVPTMTWMHSYASKPGVDILPVLGLQLGAAYRHRRLELQVSYNYTLTPSMRITPPAASVFHHRFSAVQLAASYSLFQK